MRDSRKNADGLKPELVQLPIHLDEASIDAHLRALSRSDPAHLPGAVRSVIEKWAYGWGASVQRSRLSYVRTLLEQLDVSKDVLLRCLEMNGKLADYQDQQDDRRAARECGVAILKAQAEAEEARVRIEEAKTKVAQARKTREDLEHPLEPPREKTASEQRQAKYRDADEKVKRLQKRKARRLEDILRGRQFEHLDPHEQEEYRADENSYDVRIRDAKNERMKFE
jgi:hypothetical protein